MALKAPLGATYGWRARIGFVTPSPGHENNGYEFYLMAPDGVTIVMTSLHVTQLTQQQYDDAVSRIDVAVAELEDRRVDSIIQAGVPLVVTRGWGFEEKLLAEVARQTAIPFATDIGACIRAMHTLGMKRVVMLTPFDESMDRQLAEYVGHAGIEVVARRSLWPSDEAAMSRRYGVSTMPLAEPLPRRQGALSLDPRRRRHLDHRRPHAQRRHHRQPGTGPRHPRGDQYAGHDVGRPWTGTCQGRGRGLRPVVRPRLRFEIVSFPDLCW